MINNQSLPAARERIKIAKNMNNIEQIENIYRLYYNKPVHIETCDPNIFTSSPKEYGQYLQNKKRKRK